MISFPCPQCSKPLKVKPELAGKKVKCPSCGQTVPVPSGVPASSPNHPHSEAPKEDRAARKAGNPFGRTSASSGAEDNTVAPGAPPGPDGDFLSPPRGPSEIGWLGSYRVLKVLGSGGMGVVYMAEDPTLKRIVALKAMRPALAASASAGQRFLREAQATAAIKHDNIVTIYQVAEDRGVPFIAMEFLEGEPLNERLLREGKLKLADIYRIGKEIARGLAAAHKRDLIHRDIKPANIWLEAETNRVKIVDFGLARAVRQESTLTQPGAILGTPAYMAPEQAGEKGVDHRCDLFSLGCVLYEMCTGSRPFQADDTIATLMAVATESPLPPCERSRQVPAPLSNLVMKLLEKKPENRPASAQAVVDALTTLEADPTEMIPAGAVKKRAEAAAAIPERASPQPPKVNAGKPRRGFPWLVLLLAAALTGGAVFLVLQMNEDKKDGKRGEVVQNKDEEAKKGDKPADQSTDKPSDNPADKTENNPEKPKEKILFDGKNLSGWVSRKTGGPATWKVSKGYVETNGSGDIYTKEKFGPHFQLHVEFMIVKSAKSANSGVFLQGRYEIQISDSYNKFSVTDTDCAALYYQIAPAANASKAPGEWQTFDITFRAPRPAAGVKGRLTVVHNGTKVIDNKPFEKVSPSALDEHIPRPGPIMLEDVAGVVRFRNIRLTELPLR